MGEIKAYLKFILKGSQVIIYLAGEIQMNNTHACTILLCTPCLSRYYLLQLPQCATGSSLRACDRAVSM